MNPRVLTAVSAWFSLLVPSQACGPFFPDTVLDKPQAALAVPPVSYLHNLYRVAGKQPPKTPSSFPWEPAPLLSQIPLEVAELRALWEKEGTAEDVIARRVRFYEEVRQKLLAPLPAPYFWMAFPRHTQPPEIPVRPLGNEYPQDVADYVEAARLLADGETAEARAIWKSILDLPAAERRLRGAWAAWMLAKTSGESRDEAISWFERVQAEVRDGASDILRLDMASKCLLAGKAFRENRMEEAVSIMHTFYDAFIAGKEAAAMDLRQMGVRIISSEDHSILQKAAADPLVRRLINLEIYASLDGNAGFLESPMSGAADQPETPLMRWLTVLESVAPEDHADSSRMAWALYSSGRYDDAKRWLATCPEEDALALWLQAKFDLRDGNLTEANKNLAEAVKLRSKAAGWTPSNPNGSGMRWFADASDIDGTNQSRMLADSGIVSLALKDYLAALESLRKGGYPEDAAYLAECVISTDGLLRHVRKVVPEWVPEGKNPSENEEEEDPPSADIHSLTFAEMMDRGVPIGRMGPDNILRYQLGRRLAREGRFKEAREFMPPPLVPLFDHYVKLDKARRSGRYTGKTLAAITWNQALMHRHLGAELFATDSSPDGGAVNFNYAGTRFHEIRTLRAGWKYDWSQDPAYIPGIAPEDKAIPEVTTDEVARMKKNSVRPMMRYHYRYVAADLAWQATRCLPPNHPDLARMYNTAGQWISINDPKAADRFYQAMVRRCAGTPEGKAADEKRWFLADLAPLRDLPYLPAALLPPQTASNP